MAETRNETNCSIVHAEQYLMPILSWLIINELKLSKFSISYALHNQD